ncbi:MAG: GNAT family N-acetyltransferase [Promethearchaeota archaeon]
MFQDIEIIEEIHDSNIYLRKISKIDAKFLYNSLKQREITNYMSLGPLKTYESSKRLIGNYLKYWDNFSQYNYIIEIREGIMINSTGSISLWNINWHHRRAEIGIWLVPDYWNLGIGEKAINMIKIISFNHFKLNRLEAHIAIKNKRSISVFKKCNFIEEGTLHQYLNFDGKYYDALILACLKAKKYKL